MHTEDIRVRRAARYFRNQVVDAADSVIMTADDLLEAAERLTGFSRVELPADDPLLVGANAILDRAFQTIWLNGDRHRLTKFVDASHEFGHLFLHDFQQALASELLAQYAPGYSTNQRDEVDAHRFADEFLLPLPEAKKLFLDGKSASEIASIKQLPRHLVTKQLAIALASSDDPVDCSTGVQMPLDRWQEDAARYSDDLVVYGTPGTGKTRSLIGRCQYLVKTLNVPPSSILVVADTPDSAAEIRAIFVTLPEITYTLIPIATPYSLAYDILVRFPASVGLLTGWETGNGSDPSDYPRLALTALRQEPEVTRTAKGRYRFILVDNLDRMTPDGRNLLDEILSVCHLKLWVTSGNRLDIKAKQVGLPYSYGVSPSIHSFYNEAVAPTDRPTLCRRQHDARCCIGSVSVAIANTPDRLVQGVEQFVREKIAEGYMLDDISLLHGVFSGTDTLLKNRIDESLARKSVEQTDKTYRADLLAIVDVCCGNWHRQAILRVGRMPRYSVPLTQLVAACRLSDAGRFRTGAVRSKGWTRLLADIRRCKIALTPREALELYLFEVSDYLRSAPMAGRAAQQLLYQLPLQKIENFSKLPPTEGARRQKSARRSSIVIVVDSHMSFHEGRDADAASMATDHLLYCRLENTTLGIASARKSTASLAGVTLLDWTVEASAVVPKQSAIGGNLTEAEMTVFEQCPRRVYYSRVLEVVSTINTLPITYPARPADPALCETCRFADVCPVDLT